MWCQSGGVRVAVTAEDGAEGGLATGVYLVLGSGNAISEEELNDVGSFLNGHSHFFAVASGKLLENVSSRVHASGGTSDANSDTQLGFCAQMLGHGFESVVSAFATSTLDAQSVVGEV